MITIIGADTNTLQIALLIVSACFLPMIVWMIVAGIRVKTIFAQYAQVQSEKGYTGAQAARAILDANGLSDVQIVRCAGSLTDHYDPTTRTVALSQATHDSTSIAAIGVAAHEVGHAIQHEEEYKPVKIRTALVPVVNFTAKLSMPLILLALVFEMRSCSALLFLLLSVYPYYIAYRIQREFACEKTARRLRHTHRGGSRRRVKSAQRGSEDVFSELCIFSHTDAQTSSDSAYKKKPQQIT